MKGIILKALMSTPVGSLAKPHNMPHQKLFNCLKMHQRKSRTRMGEKGLTQACRKATVQNGGTITSNIKGNRKSPINPLEVKTEEHRGLLLGREGEKTREDTSSLRHQPLRRT